MDTNDSILHQKIRYLEERIELLEHHDRLTGLMDNRIYLEKIDEILTQNPNTEFSLLYFSIKKLKIMNIQQGIEYTDNFLCYIADRLTHSLETNSFFLVSRVYADAFSVFLPKALEESVIAQIFLAFQDFSKTIILPSIGIRHITGPEIESSQLLNQAYMAAASIYNIDSTNVAVYGGPMYKDFAMEQMILADFKAALKNHEFQLYFQPKYNIASGKIIGSEALVRWPHPTAGFISPGFFIPILEANDLIQELDCYIWELLCSHLHSWRNMGCPPLPVSVNASRISICSMDVASILEDLIKKYDIPPSLVELEITESIYAEHSDTIKDTIDKLHKTGFTVLMDDFGSGYSSLSFLADTNVDVIKLDMRFLNCNTPKSNYILSSVIRTCYWLNHRIIAEGVENQAQVNSLLKMGCFYAQGYLFSKPLPKQEYEKLISSNSAIDLTDRGSQTGNLGGVISFLDIFSQETLNEQLTEQLLGATVIFSMTGSQLSMLNVNKTFCSLFQLNEVPVYGDDLNSILDLEKPEYFLSLCRYARKRNSSHGESFYLHSRTKPYMYQISLYCLTEKSDSAIFYAQISDASDLYNSLMNASCYGQQLQMIMESSGILFFSLNTASHKAICSSYACQLLGLPSGLMKAPEDFLKQKIVNEGDEAEFCRLFLSACTESTDSSCRLSIRLADASYADACITIKSLACPDKIHIALGFLELL